MSGTDDARSDDNHAPRTLDFRPGDPLNFALWAKVTDRRRAVEMPPKKKPRPDAAEMTAFATDLAASLTSYEKQNVVHEGRATQRGARVGAVRRGLQLGRPLRAAVQPLPTTALRASSE